MSVCIVWSVDVCMHSVVIVAVFILFSGRILRPLLGDNMSAALRVRLCMSYVQSSNILPLLL